MWSAVLLFVSWFVSAPRVYSWLCWAPLTAAMMLSWLAAVLHCRRRNDTVDGISCLFYPTNNASGSGGGTFCPRIFQVYIHMYVYVCLHVCKPVTCAYLSMWVYIRGDKSYKCMCTYERRYVLLCVGLFCYVLQTNVIATEQTNEWFHACKHVWRHDWLADWLIDCLWTHADMQDYVCMHICVYVYQISIYIYTCLHMYARERGSQTECV